jgi:hypothetical protein
VKTLKNILRIPAGIVVAFLLWVGAAQAGVALLGPDNDGIIIFGVVGLFTGTGVGMRIILGKDFDHWIR